MADVSYDADEVDAELAGHIGQSMVTIAKMRSALAAEMKAHQKTREELAARTPPGG